MFKPTHSRISLLAALGALALPAIACDVPVEDPLAEGEAPAELAAKAELAPATRAKAPVADYFIATRQDTRRCAAPMCGGHFVARVNTSVARCADGTWQEECHMFELDLSKLRLDRSTEAKAREAFGAGNALVRGELAQVTLDELPAVPADVLVASEIWIGATGNKPEGHFSRVEDTGIVCVTYPCPTLSERSLNTNLSGSLDGIDLAAARGATSEQIEHGTRELSAGGLLVAGRHTVSTGPAGSMNRLDASEFYVRLR
ncbi:DUF6748 domain-containing protein [Sorangium sp. So ce1024]|uniref:DUF6748 domain-containing protein n=1 Tax=Sorangium sp. So ce1024 TaxID=3133327 RepID=UPI003F11C8F6